MSFTAKSPGISTRKKDLFTQKNLALGFQNFKCWHKAVAGEAGLNFNSLTMPPEMTALGYVQPSISDLNSANILFLKNNVQIQSTARNDLQLGTSFNISSSAQITWSGFTALEGEIFTITVNPLPKTNLNVVDASAISVSATLAALATDFNVGTPFQTNLYPSARIGAVRVYDVGNNKIFFRNTGNSSVTLDGDYYELAGGNGLGTIIRFNLADPVDARTIHVESNGLLVERPDGSMMAVIEAVNGKLNNMANYVAAAALGSSSAPNVATVLGATPSNVDLKAFGDRVAALEVFRSVSAAYAAVAGDRLMLDSSGSAFTVTLPASPVFGNMIELFDATGSWATNNVTLARNGSNIEGTAVNFTANVAGDKIRLVYFNTAQGWRIY